MLTALVVASLVLAAVGLVMFTALCLAIRLEDRSSRLNSQPPSAGTAVTRRIAGLSVRRAATTAQSDPPEPRAALWPAPYPPDLDQEGR